MSLLTNTTKREVARALSGEEAVQRHLTGLHSVTIFEPAEHYNADLVSGLPASLVKAYAAAATKHAVFLDAGGEWFAEIKGLEGVWGKADSVHGALEDLEESIVGWVALKLERGSHIPTIEGFDLNPAESRGQAS